MVSLAEQSFADMFSHNDTDEYTRYPDPPHSASSYDTNTTPMDMNSMYGLPSVGFEQSLYAEASNYIINHNRASPGLYHEEGDLRLPSASLSTNSATSSDVPSPESTPGHPLGSSSEWNPNGPHPSIVSNDFEYVANHEYTGYPSQGMEEFAYDYATQSKGYVGKSILLCHPSNLIICTVVTSLGCRLVWKVVIVPLVYLRRGVRPTALWNLGGLGLPPGLRNSRPERCTQPQCLTDDHPRLHSPIPSIHFYSSLARLPATIESRVS
jgi:hypothetical protein